ncbi:MAG: hypothetical protein II811_03165 [Spirochaetaceae bacterium]|nr:hypothetical protein [Spirochaetaceae bacterium]
MCPKEFAMILKDALDAFETWYSEGCSNKEADKDSLQEAYTHAHIGIVARLQRMMGDGFSEDDDEEIEDGEAFESFLEKAFMRKVQEYATDIAMQPIMLSLEQHNELAMKQIRAILSAYSGKVIEGDEDDGIEGEEAEARHRVFDGTLSAIGFVKDGTLNKKAVAATFRVLADFYEKEW